MKRGIEQSCSVHKVHLVLVFGTDFKKLVVLFFKRDITKIDLASYQTCHVSVLLCYADNLGDFLELQFAFNATCHYKPKSVYTTGGFSVIPLRALDRSCYQPDPPTPLTIFLLLSTSFCRFLERKSWEGVTFVHRTFGRRNAGSHDLIVNGVCVSY